MQSTRRPPTRTTPLLLAALAVGIAGDLLIPRDLWRAGFALWMALVAIVAIVLRTRADGGAPAAMTAEDRRTQGERTALILGAAIAAAGLAWRDAEPLLPIDLLSTLCMGALVAWHGTGRRLGELTVVQALRAAVIGVATLAAGAAGALRDGAEHSATRAATARHLRSLAIGIVLAIPPLLLVAGLLSASDQRFASYIVELRRLLTTTIARHLLATAVVTWLAAGWLRSALRDRGATIVPEIPSPRVPFLTVSVGLIGLIGLLALYLTTQAQALFGGAEHLLATVGLTPAEYARRGFFEMVIAAGVVVATLVVADWLLADDETARGRFGTLGGVLVVEVAALLVSAAARMRLYVAEFGLTEDRLLATALMVLVAGALVVVLTTLPRGQSARFAPRMLGVTIGWVALLNVANPDAIVVRTNLARAAEGKTFDVAYHAALSGDAVAVLREEAGRLPAPTCAALSTALAAHWSKRVATSSGDWRSESLSSRRARAWQAAGATLPCRVDGAAQ